MECIVWAGSKARVDSNEESRSEEDKEAERDDQNDKGLLLEAEKENLRNVQLTDLLAHSRERPRDEGEQARGENQNDLTDCSGDNYHDNEDDDDETTAELKTSLAHSSKGSLHHRPAWHF